MALIDLLNFQWVSKIGQAWPIFLAVKKKRQHIREQVVGRTFQSSLIVESLSLCGPVGSQPWLLLFLGQVSWQPWPHLFLGPSLVQSAALVSGSISSPVGRSCFWVQLAGSLGRS